VAAPLLFIKPVVSSFVRLVAERYYHHIPSVMIDQWRRAETQLYKLHADQAGHWFLFNRSSCNYYFAGRKVFDVEIIFSCRICCYSG